MIYMLDTNICISLIRQHPPQVLSLLIERIPVMPFTWLEAEQFGILRAAIRERKKDALDRLIAAHAIALRAVLVTNKEADFKDSPGLQIENWAASASSSDPAPPAWTRPGY